MDPVRILLFVVVSVLTILLVSVGVQVFLILQDLRKTLRKFNRVVDDLHLISNSFAKPVAAVTGFFENIKHFGELVDFLADRRTKFQPGVESAEERLQVVTPTYEEDGFEQQHPTVAALQERGRRFFHRDGKPLTS